MIGQPNADALTNPIGPDAGGPPLDACALLEHCMGNAALVAMLFDKFEVQAREDVARIERALRASDAEQAARASHALKGAAGAMSATDVQRAAALIELASRGNCLDVAAAGLNDLKAEVDRCLAYLPTARATTKRDTPTPTH